MRPHDKGKYQSTDNTKIGIKGGTLTQKKMKRSPNERHK
jgi:hypothetical protein